MRVILYFDATKCCGYKGGTLKAGHVPRLDPPSNSTILILECYGINFSRIRTNPHCRGLTLEYRVLAFGGDQPDSADWRIDSISLNTIAPQAGQMISAFEKGLADDVAARQKGVKAVHNFIAVKGSSVITYDPYIDSWDLHDYEWYTVNDKLVSAKTDWEIERNIKDELFWSPFVDADQVKVEVDNGVAELTGTVDTWSEREAAGENALEGGALIVDNDLAVSYGPDYYRP